MTRNALLTALEAEDWPKAERLLRRMAETRGAGASVFYNLGKVLFLQNEPRKAMAQFRKALALEGTHVAAWFEAGRAALALDDLGEAESCFGTAHRLAPEDADAASNYGRVALRRGHWRAALEALAPLGGAEDRIAAFRAALESGEDARGRLRALLAEPALRPAVLTAMTRTAKGRMPLRL